MDELGLPLSLALAGLDAGTLGAGAAPGERAGQAVGATTMQAFIGLAQQTGMRAVHLDATASGVRPRDLDRSGRRDLAGLLRRSGLALSGLDVFIPAGHFVESGRVDRAVSSTLAAIELASDLADLAGRAGSIGTAEGRPTVGLTLPEGLPGEVLAAMKSQCERWGVRIADYRWPWSATPAHDEMVGVGLDPATVLAAGEDPSALASRLGGSLVCARLSDSSKHLGSARVAPGSTGGRLDLTAYGVALVTAGYRSPVVLDLRGVSGQGDALRGAAHAWSGAH